MNTQLPRVASGLRKSWSLAVGGTLLATGWIGAAASSAGTIRHDVSDTLYRNLATQPQFAGVGHYSAGAVYGSFTLIAPNWGLTAAHVVDVDLNGQLDDTFTNDTLSIGSQQRTVTQAIVPVGINGNRGWNGNINAGFDIALVRFDTPFTDIAPASLYRSFQELGKTITQVGYGGTGTGTTGAYIGGGRSSKRAGNNVVDRYVNFSNGAAALRWDFDEPSPGTSPNWSGSGDPLDLEYLIAGGDSGGGSFIFEDNAWYLAGVHSGTYPSHTYDDDRYPAPRSNNSTYGDEALITRVAAYQDFIFNSIPELAAVPEPTAVSIMLIGTAALLRRTRRGRDCANRPVDWQNSA